MLKLLHHRPMKVLPTIYEDALSYMEVQGKMILSINELIEGQNELYDVMKSIGNSNNLERDYAKDSYLGRAFNGLSRKVLSITGELRNHEKRIDGVTLYISKIEDNAIEIKLHDHKIRLNLDFSDYQHCGLITRIRGYGFNQYDLYKFGDRHDDESVKVNVYVNGVRKLTNGVALTDVFYLNQSFKSILVTMELTNQYMRAILIDLAGIHIYRTYPHVEAPHIRGDYWVDIVRNDNFQLVSNEEGSVVKLHNYTAGDLSVTDIAY